MATWKERGEVPDSEDDSDFDTSDAEHQNDSLPTQIAVSKQVLQEPVPRDGDIWEIPHSSQGQHVTSRPEKSSRDATPARNNSSTLATPRAAVQSSLPHGSVPPSRRPTEPEKRVGISPVVEGSIHGVQGDEHIVSGSRTEYVWGPVGISAGDFAPRRSFRPRKPIQEHPYLLEKAIYDQSLKSRGVRPVRFDESSERRHGQQQEDDSQEKDFEDDSQETEENGRLETSEESQQYDARVSDHGEDDLDDLPDVFQSTPKTPLPRHRDETSSEPSGDDTDGTSHIGEDFPTLDELVRAPPLPSTMSLKRKASIRYSSKRRRLDAKDGHHNASASKEIVWSLSPSPPPHRPVPRLIIPSEGFSSKPASPAWPSPPAANVPSSPPVLRSVSPVRCRPCPSNPIDSAILIREDDTASAEKSVEISSTSESDSGAESEPEKEPDRRWARKLHGVLPPSYLKLNIDSRGARRSGPRSTHHKPPSPERFQRRGVAKPKTPGSEAPATHAFIFDDSEDEDELLSQQDDLPQQELVQTRICIESDDGDSSAMEDNRVDPMFQAPSKRKSPSTQVPRHGPKKRVKTSHGHRHRVLRETQPRITSHFNTSGAKRSFSGVLSGRTGKKPQRRTKRSGQTRLPVQKRQPPPRLSILDVIETEAPRFLKVAARAARQSEGLGRSSPGRKMIQMATAWDHQDVHTVLNDWRGGHLKARLSPNAKPTRHVLSAQSSRPRQSTGSKFSKPKTTKRFVIKRNGPTGKATLERVSDPGSIISADASSSKAIFRQAQLETTTMEAGKYIFHSRKRQLDTLWRRGRRDESAIAPTVVEVFDRPPSPDPSSTAQRIQTIQNRKELPPNIPKSRFRKRFQPREVDILAPQYMISDDVVLSPIFETERRPTETPGPGLKLLGLGPFGTRYTHNFGIFPLERGVFFHSSTLLGQGRVEKSTEDHGDGRLHRARPRHSFTLGDQVLRWGSWDEQESSELGILLDWIVEHFQVPATDFDASNGAAAIGGASYLLNYVQDSLTFAGATAEQAFFARVVSVLQGFIGKVETHKLYHREHCREAFLQVLTRILIATFTCYQICRKLTSAMGHLMACEEAFLNMSQTCTRALLHSGLDAVRKLYEDSRRESFRERGIRPNNVAAQAWVVLMRLLEDGRIPRSGFWDILASVLVDAELRSETNSEKLEDAWRTVFTLLPLREFDSLGTLRPGISRLIPMDGWTLPQTLLLRVFDIYKSNKEGQSPSFNEYCRILIGRCFFLCRDWGWIKCNGIIGKIFDFFASESLFHLRNEEANKSPRFLEELSSNPSLSIEREDKCFHIFLKFVALAIRRLNQRGGEKEARNLVTRILPNHNRLYNKEHNLDAKDLASLRNHHDLLCTLFWVSPPNAKPSLHMIQGLIDPASSHTAACLVSLRAWNQIARFAASTMHDQQVFHLLQQWQSDIFSVAVDQFDSAASVINQQVMALSKADREDVNESYIELLVSQNKRAAKELIHACVRASLDVMRHAQCTASAKAVLNASQLKTIFDHFSCTPRSLDWSTLRSAIETLEAYLPRLDLDESGGPPISPAKLGGASVSDCIASLNEELGAPFFSMARWTLASNGDQEGCRMSAMEMMHRATCAEASTILAAKLVGKFAKARLLILRDLMCNGELSLFDDGATNIPLSQRKYMPLFVANLLKEDVPSVSELGDKILEAWLQSIVQPQRCLSYENTLAEELRRRTEPFIPDRAIGLSTNPDYLSNRVLFECESAKRNLCCPR